ncbi:MAG TPA: hypothetical protein VHL51_00460 [Gaiellales bacterium]|jgi:hypothetical protein|nr:hypothetical protein [Gaiellales bacterium]
MENASPWPEVVAYGTLLAALGGGAVVGYLRAWLYAALGAAAFVGMAFLSRFVSNDTLPGREDLSWQIVLVFTAIEAMVLFFVAMGGGRFVRALVDLSRYRRGGAPD